MKPALASTLSLEEILKRYFTATRLVEQEFDGVALPVEGVIPEELSGTLYRNGNGRFEHQGIPYNHLFDGDGMPVAFKIENGKITYRNRYVRTREFVKEEAAGKMLFRSFGTNIPGGIRTNLGRMRFKNASNTNIVFHAGKLLSLWEGGLPHVLDPDTLETIERYDYEGRLKNPFGLIDRLINPELPFSAHPKIHPTTGVLHNFGTLAGATQRLLTYEVSPDGEASISQIIPLKQLSFTHDFVLTDKGYQVFFLVPVAFNVFKAFSGLESPVDSIKVERNKPTQVLVIHPDGQQQRIEMPFCFLFHYVNGFELDEQTLVVDALALPDFPTGEQTQKLLQGEAFDGLKGRLWRNTIHLDSGRVDREQLTTYGLELPNIHSSRQGLPYRYVWGISSPDQEDRPLLDGLSKVDLQSGETTFLELFGKLPGEPVFVPKENATAEDDGWLLYVLFDAETISSDLIIADASSLETVASAKLPHNIPLGFHGFWMSA